MVNHTNNFKQNLVNLFPKVELSYERFLHKKVSNFDTLMAIPKGPKCYLWITKYNGNNISVFFILDNQKQIKKEFGLDISVEEMPEVTNKSLAKEIYNFPTSVLPYNSMYDIKRKLPLFTKSVKSKSLYCAGYYIIRFEKGWVKSFCPKLITIERYDFKGPFKTEIEMRQELSRV